MSDWEGVEEELQKRKERAKEVARVNLKQAMSAAEESIVEILSTIYLDGFKDGFLAKLREDK